MRVIAGKYRHITLVAPNGTSVTRPTLDRIKEAMFNILNMYVIDAVVVDLFSGSGALGIEALSRGASHVYFNDQDNNAQKSIKENLVKIKANNLNILSPSYIFDFLLVFYSILLNISVFFYLFIYIFIAHWNF